MTIEAHYTVGEYDILILSAQQSSGLETWLRENGYRIPAGASAVLASYLKQNMRFFVAKVNLTEQAKLGFTYLRPLQVAYESPKFMLPIRLGTVNANGAAGAVRLRADPQGPRRDHELPHREAAIGHGAAGLPEGSRRVRQVLQGDVQRARSRRRTMRVLFLEYAWDMGWCDPCAADPLSNDELRQLGVFWAATAPAAAAGPNVFLTRLHVRYDNAHFPEDLVFQETADRTNFQGRYVLRHAWQGEETCAGRRRVSPQPARPARAGGAAPGIDDRMGGLRDPEEDEAWRRGSPAAADLRQVVGAAVEEIDRKGPAARGALRRSSNADGW